MTIDGKEINPAFFETYDQTVTYPRFYLKANQTLKVHIVRENVGLHVSIFPLASGGLFFIDTTHPEDHYKTNEPAVKDANGTWTYTAPNYPVLICGYKINYVPSQTASNRIEFYINDVPCPPTRADGLVLLRAHDELRIVNSGITYYCEYPLIPLDDESESESESESISRPPIFDTDQADVDGLEFFKQEGLTVNLTNKIFPCNCRMLILGDTSIGEM